jgi:hypothetical protein
VFAAKVALLFPFPDLHDETLARLAAIRETKRAFSHKKRKPPLDKGSKPSDFVRKDPDPAFAALAAVRLPSLLSSDSRAGPSTPRAKSARDLAAETVLARFAFAFRRRARDEEDFDSRDDDALAAFAASAFAAARRYDDAARVLAARSRTHASLATAADAAPALVQRFLASKRSLFDDLFVHAVREPGHGGDGSRPGGVAAFAAAAAARLLADARAEGARALAEDLR